MHAIGLNHGFGQLAHIAMTAATLVARQHQQGRGQVDALAGGAINPQQALARTFGHIRRRQQQFGRPQNHRQRCTQFVTDIGIELPIPRYPLGQLIGVIVQGLGQQADFISGKMRGQALARDIALKGLHMRGQVGYRAHHPA